MTSSLTTGWIVCLRTKKLSSTGDDLERLLKAAARLVQLLRVAHRFHLFEGGLLPNATSGALSSPTASGARRGYPNFLHCFHRTPLRMVQGSLWGTRA